MRSNTAMKNMDHPTESRLALYAGGDLDFLDRLQVGWHVRGCSRCGSTVASHKVLRRALVEPIDSAAGESVKELFPSNWNRLGDEMTANIRLGLSAAECIGPAKPPFGRGQFRTWKTGSRSKYTRFAQPVSRAWVPAVTAFGLCLLSAGAFWLNTPPEQRHTLARAWDAISHGGVAQGERGVILEVSQTGLEMKQDGRALIAVRSPRPATMSASLGGSIRAGYVDDETGQVTYTNVYSGQ